MAEVQQDQDRSEEASPFKLQKARARGSVARGTDLGFFTAIVGAGGFLVFAGTALGADLSDIMRRSLSLGIANSGDPARALSLTGAAASAIAAPLALFGATVFAVVALGEVVQIGGIAFSAQPLHPDFTRLNPARGLKRLFSLLVLKQSLKSIAKLAGYTLAAWFLVKGASDHAGAVVTGAGLLAATLQESAVRLLWTFALLALLFGSLDQILARNEFRKQMRMSRRDLVREAKEREGDPRLRSKRKQLHGEFAKRSRGLAALPGSDLVVVNPDHVAVALAYDRAKASAPVVRTKARDLHAMMIKRRAAMLGIPVIRKPALARALYADSAEGREIQPHHFHAVAELYFKVGITQKSPS